ncbi:hypothetical protein CCACVL1_19854 [Corchorus capsularis]|uniref:Uncharacterized protein n=1 Tax=Corchorus capsularis TaxID=210143 RepID=A0A1R3HEM4_COCAP|nr:hypothetical protein CCACVL1_19854 [Corchorus capsularis]
MDQKSLCSLKEVISCQQFPDEHWTTYWERYNKLCESNPDHGLSELHLIQIFYYGLSHKARECLDYMKIWINFGIDSTTYIVAHKIMRLKCVNLFKYSNLVCNQVKGEKWEILPKEASKIGQEEKEASIKVPIMKEIEEVSSATKDDSKSQELKVQDPIQFFSNDEDDAPCMVCIPTTPEEIPKIVHEERVAPKEDVEMDIPPPSPPKIAKHEEPPYDEHFGHPKDLKDLVDDQVLELTYPNLEVDLQEFEAKEQRSVSRQEDMSSGGQALEHMGPKTNQVGRQACDMGAQPDSGVPPSSHMDAADLVPEANDLGAQCN